VERARGNLDSITRIVARLGELGNTAAAELVDVDLRATLGAVRLLAASELELVQVEEVIEGEARARSETHLLTHTLLQLATNAAHAAATLPSPRVRFHVYDTGREVVVSVRDNGPGVPLEAQASIFEPFFTTRAGDGATGLGLALCRAHARRLGARLSLWSAPGRGACFRLALPRA
jgi:signal transduction histidine kinase